MTQGPQTTKTQPRSALGTESCPFPFSPSTWAEQGLLNSANRKVIPLNSSFQPQTGTTLQSRSQGNNACAPPHSLGAKTRQERKGEAVGFLTEAQY